MLNIQDIFNSDDIKLAYFRVKCWSEKNSKDLVGLRAFGNSLDKNCNELSVKIFNGTWVPSKGFKFFQPKSSGTQRTKTLLFVEDAIVYQAIANKLAQDNYEQFNENNEFVFGSVLSPEVTKGIDLLKENEPDYFFFLHWGALYKKFIGSVRASIETDDSKFRLETDITGFFDSIPHYNLLSLLSERYHVGDDILDLLSDCLNLWSGTKESMTPGVGIPQGPAPSYFFANLYLHDLDEIIIAKVFKYYRYMDDIKIYWYNKKELNNTLVLIDNHLKGKGLSLNSKKTSIDELTFESKQHSIFELEKKLMTQISFTDSEFESISKFGNSPNGFEELSNNLEQTMDLHEFDHVHFLETITNRGDIVVAWQEELEEVTSGLKDCFIDATLETDALSFKKDVSDNQLIGYSFRFYKANRALKDLAEEYILDKDLIKLWLCAFEQFYWRASSFGLTLSLYGPDDTIKKVMTRIATEDAPTYEWLQYQAILQLSINHSFSDKELREVFFRFLTNESSALVRLGLYRLLFRHGEKTLISALKKALQKEPVHYLKIQVADFNKRFSAKEIDMVEFIDFIGI